jgi:hypothetical protein
MTWLHYVLEANIYLSVFYLLYFVSLNTETYYKLNRVYLLAACFVAYLLPLIQISALKPVEHPVQLITAVAFTGFQTQTEAAGPIFTLQDAVFYGYLLGVAVMLVVLIFKFLGLIKLGRAPKAPLENKYKLITIEDSNTAFSFFNYLFIGTKVSGKDTVIRHELVHIRGKHSFDIVFLELLKIVSWFNPFVYLLQFSLKTVHEYIADEQTAAYENDALAYSSLLVSNAYGVGGSSITHSFFNYNLLKKRIIMLHQKRSGNLARLKYLMALPVCAAMLCASTLGFSKTYGWIDLAPAHKNDTGRNVYKVTMDNYRVNDTTYTNAKGYKIQEKTIIDNGKVSQRVTITGKDGNAMTYFSGKASPAQRKLLLDKYGYKFPVVITNIVLAPPPPIGKNKIPPPPPPKASAKMHNKPAPPLIIPDVPRKSVKASPAVIENLPPPPAPPKKSKMTNKGVVYNPSRLMNSTSANNLNKLTPIVIVNGAVYSLNETLKKGQKLVVDADSVVAVMYTHNDLQQAIKRYGPGAQNGVIFAYGKASVKVK